MLACPVNLETVSWPRNWLLAFLWSLYLWLFKIWRDLNVFPQIWHGKARPSMCVSTWFFMFLLCFTPDFPHNLQEKVPSSSFTMFSLSLASTSSMAAGAWSGSEVTRLLLSGLTFLGPDLDWVSSVLSSAGWYVDCGVRSTNLFSLLSVKVSSSLSLSGMFVSPESWNLSATARNLSSCSWWTWTSPW